MAETSKPVSNIRITGPDIKATINWDAVADVVTGTGLQALGGLFGIAPTPGNFSGVFQNLRKVIKLEDSHESKAWHLTALCFAAAIDELRPGYEDEAAAQTREQVRDVLQKAKDQLEAETYYLEPAFFTEQPIRLSLYQDMRATLAGELARLWPGQADLGGKLDRAFNAALFRLRRYDRDLVAELEGIVTAGHKIAQHEQDWAAYRGHLIHEFDVKPVFGQEENRISLSQLYVPPRGIWTEKPRSSDEARAEREAKDNTVHHVVDMQTDCQAWLDARDPRRAIRLIRGTPGVGKSSFAKKLAADLARDENWRPLLIELQHLKGLDDLADQIRRYLLDVAELFTDDPLDKANLDANRPLVLILDGLDELVVPETAGAQRVAEQLWDEVDALLDMLNTSEQARALAFITGRNAIIDAARQSRKGKKLPDKDVLGVAGLHAIKGDGVVEESGDRGDQLPAWWTGYAAATGAPSALPPIFNDPTLAELSDEPLLCYLIALSGKAEESRDTHIENINEIYDSLFVDIWARRWAPEAEGASELPPEQRIFRRSRGVTGAFAEKDKFEQVLEFVALAAWHSGESRVATVQAFEAAIKDTDAEEIWTEFKDNEFVKGRGQAEDPSFSTLALTFFFRTPQGAESGFEFTHRSFGEYLAARCLVRHVAAWCENFAHARRADKLADWLGLTGAAVLAPSILNFLRGEMRRRSVEDLSRWRKALANAMRITLRDGLPARFGERETWRQAETRQRNAEGALLACLSTASEALIEKEPSVGTIDPGFEDLISAKQLLGRLSPNRIPINVFHGCLCGLDLSRQTLQNEEFMFSSFAYSVLKYVVFINADIKHSNLEGADLSSADFRSSFLMFSNLKKTILSKANFDRCILTESDLRGSDLSGANLNNAVLYDADLRTAKNLTQEQIDSAFGNEETRLPEGLERPAHWTDTEKTD